MPEFNNIPPIVPKRNEFGLLENVNYIFDERSGFVNWRAMIDPAYLRVNNSYKEIVEEKYGKDYKITDVDDRYLLILLEGIKKIAKLRGYEEVNYEMIPLSDNFVVGICKIDWIVNYETEQGNITFSDVADATITNASGFGKCFLSTVCANRAFVRCVRNFLGIAILGFDEISPEIKPEEPEAAPENKSTDPHDILRDLMEKVGISFEKLKTTCEKKGDDVDSWNDVYTVPTIKCFELISRLGKLEKK